MEFEIQYTTRTFSGLISMGRFTVEADSLNAAKENAFNMYMEMLKDREDDWPWWHDIESVKLFVGSEDDDNGKDV